MAAHYERKTSFLDFFLTEKLSPLPHLHKELELIYVIKGRSRAIVNRKVYDLSAGDVFLTFPYQVHYYLDCEPGEYCVHAFPASILLTSESIINNNELLNNVFHIDPESPEADLFSKIQLVENPHAIPERCAYLTLIMLSLLPKCQLVSLKQSSSLTVKSILEYCSQHYTENLSLDTLAASLHLNKYYISHCINNQLNMRLNTFINSLRIDEACRLLESTDRRIGDIAQSVGFETIRSFNRAFVEIIGNTPKEYRLNHLSNNRITESSNL